MNESSVTLNADGVTYPGRLDAPDGESDRGILVVPGAGHGPFGDVFDRFAEAAAANGHSVARFETWEDQEDLADKSESNFEAEIDASVDFLRSRGCSTITVVAKSFGGRLALEHLPDAADRLVLWAPAVMFGEHSDAPSITVSELAAVDVPVRILQGNEDEVMTPENAATIAEHLPEGELVELPGEDHSFLNDQRRVVEETVAFLPE